MAKRRRLSPAQPDYLNPAPVTAPYTDPVSGSKQGHNPNLNPGQRAPETKSITGSVSGAGFNAPPIAQVASESATRAALDEVTGVLQDARTQGRLIEALPLAAINPHYMMRDRILREDTGDEDMEALMISLRARGQQTPIEVVALPESKGQPAYGLISGWRRLTALNRLCKDTGEDRFSTIKALVVTPDTAQHAYVAMVEENEIRVNLSLYERARIALHAADEGVFPTPRHAVLALFEAAPRAKRSKISSFIGVVQALEGVLMFPKAISEKFGLELARALTTDPELKKRLRERLTFENPQSIPDEIRLLTEELRQSRQAGVSSASEIGKGPVTEPVTDSKPVSVTAQRSTPSDASPPARADQVAPDLWLRFDQSGAPRIELSGAKVDEALCQDLREWLAERVK